MAPRVPAALLLVLICVPMFLVGLGGYDLDLKGESREAITAREMAEGGDWLLPRVNGEAFPQKPLLFPWAVALSTLVLGTGEFAVRLPSALAAVGAVLATFALGRRLLGERKGLLAGALFASTGVVVALARSARVDMTLCLWTTASMLCVLRVLERPVPGRLLALWLCVALGVLSKGPLGIVLPGLAAAAALALQGRVGVLRDLRPWPFALVPVLLAGAWYAQGLARGGEEFGSFSLLQENWRMFLGESGVHAHGPFYYVPRILLVGLPWILFVPAALARADRRDPSWAVPAAWFAVVFLVFSIGSAKRTDYLLPLMPAAALLVARLVPEADGAPREAAFLVPAALVAIAGLAGAAAFGLLLALPPERIADLAGNRVPRDLVIAYAGAAAARPSLLVLGVVASIAAGGLPLAGALRGRPFRGMAASAIAMSGVVLAAAGTFLVADAAVSTLRPFAEEIRATVPGSAALSHHRAFRFQLAWYAGRRIPSLDDSAYAGYLDSPGERWVLAPASAVDGHPPARLSGVEERARSRRPGQGPDEEFVLLGPVRPR